MLLLSRLTGQQVVARDGTPVGRLTDLTMRLDGTERVDRLVVRRPDGRSALLPWDDVGQFHPDRVIVTAEPAGTTGAPPLEPDEILLKRDVLDTQVVDVVGQRLARVADVVLSRDHDGRLRLRGVDVGFSGVLRRLGLRRVPAGADIVAWSDLHLTSERGHTVQLSTPRAAVHRLDARGLAALVSRVDVEAAGDILAVEDPALAAEAVRVAHPDVGERVLRAMPAALAARIVAAMPSEHAGPWRHRLSRLEPWRGRRFLRHRVWPHRRHLIRDRRA